jgi:hypothetical protein
MAWGKTFDRKNPERRDLTAVQQRIIPDARTVVQEVTGNYYRPGGTDVAVADGGTGAGTQAGAATNLSYSYVAAASAVQVTHTGDTNETVAATIAIPAGIGANAQIEVEVLWGKSGTAGTMTHRVRFGASGAGTGGTQMLSTTPGATNLSTSAKVRIANRNSASSQVSNHVQTTGGWGPSTTAVSTSAINTASAAEVVITYQLANGADTATLESYIVRVLPKA